jgi:hypothetical protein
MNLTSLLVVGGGVAAIAFKGKKDVDALVSAAAPIAAAKVSTGVPPAQAAEEAASIVVGDKMLPAVGRGRREHPDAWMSNRMPLPYEKDVPLESQEDKLVRRALPLTAELVKAGASVSDAIQKATDRAIVEDAFISPMLPPPTSAFISPMLPPPTGAADAWAAAATSALVSAEVPLPSEPAAERRSRGDGWMSNRMPMPSQASVAPERVEDALVEQTLAVASRLISSGVSASDAVQQATDVVVGAGRGGLSIMLPPPGEP